MRLVALLSSLLSSSLLIIFLFLAFDGWSRDPEVEWINQENGDIHIAGNYY